MKEIQKERKKLLEEECRKYRKGKINLSEFLSKTQNRNSFISVDKYKFIYNFVRKVGSSQMTKMIKGINKGSKGNGMKRMYKMSKENARTRFLNDTTFIIVRHPLARLLSAYKDKFVTHHIPHYIRIGRQIIKATRPKATAEELRAANDVTFLEFIKYVTGEKKSRRGNTHWSSLVVRNKVCDVRHDYIGKLETMTDDLNLLMTNVLHVPYWKMGDAYKDSSTNNNDIVRTYYSQIPEGLMQKIYHYYEADFRLFGYSMSIPDWHGSKNSRINEKQFIVSIWHFHIIIP